MLHQFEKTSLLPSHFGIPQSVIDAFAKAGWNWQSVLNFIFTYGIPALTWLAQALGIHLPPLPLPPVPPLPTPPTPPA